MMISYWLLVWWSSIHFGRRRGQIHQTLYRITTYPKEGSNFLTPPSPLCTMSDAPVWHKWRQSQHKGRVGGKDELLNHPCTSRTVYVHHHPSTPSKFALNFRGYLFKETIFLTIEQKYYTLYQIEQRKLLTLATNKKDSGCFLFTFLPIRRPIMFRDVCHLSPSLSLFECTISYIFQLHVIDYTQTSNDRDLFLLDVLVRQAIKVLVWFAVYQVHGSVVGSAPGPTRSRFSLKPQRFTG